MTPPPEPWVFVPVERVRIGAPVNIAHPTWSLNDLTTLARQRYYPWFPLTEQGARDHAKYFALCSASDVLPARGPSPRFPTPCPRCGAGTYSGASAFEHDGPCVPGGAP